MLTLSETTDRSVVAPEMIVPAQTMQCSATPFSTNFAGGRVSRSRMVVLRCYERQPVSGHNVDSRLSAGREVARLQPVGESRSSEGATVVVCRPGVGLCRAAALG